MRLATTTGDFDRYCDSYIEKIKHVHNAGFSYVDLSMYYAEQRDELLVSENWCENVKQLEAYVLEHDIKFVQAHGPNVNPLRSERDFFTSIDLTIRAIEVCGALGIHNMVVHPGYNETVSKQEWLEKNRDFFRALFPTMEKHQVNVLHENSASVNISCIFPKTGAEMREFSEFINHPMFHSCWDTGHANLEGSQYDEIMTIGDDLFALHINDNRGTQDEHLIPFLGTLNMDEIMHALKDIGYNGYFTLEAGSVLRPAKYWLGDRHGFCGDTRLANPPLQLQQELEAFMYHVGEYILRSYDMFEE